MTTQPSYEVLHQFYTDHSDCVALMSQRIAELEGERRDLQERLDLAEMGSHLAAAAAVATAYERMNERLDVLGGES